MQTTNIIWNPKNHKRYVICITLTQQLHNNANVYSIFKKNKNAGHISIVVQNCCELIFTLHVVPFDSMNRF